MWAPAGQASSAISGIIKEKALVYGLWLTQRSGRRAYFIIDVSRAMHERFKEEIASQGDIDLADYGSILYRGWELPSQEQQQYFREKYGLFEEK